jgi:hypothetical protein
VNISDLTIDGGNNGATTCGQGPYGIYYNLSFGVINHVAVRNQFPTKFSSNVTIENSVIHGFQGNGIEATGLGASVTIKNNSIGGLAAGDGGNGIAIIFGGPLVTTRLSM